MGGRGSKIRRTTCERRESATLKIRKAATCGCATSADASRVAIGDTRAEVAAKLHTPGRLDYAVGTHEDWRHT